MAPLLAASKEPGCTLVQAIRDAWPPPPMWREAKAYTAAVARQQEEDRQRQQEIEARRWVT